MFVSARKTETKNKFRLGKIQMIKKKTYEDIKIFMISLTPYNFSFILFCYIKRLNVSGHVYFK